MVQDFHKFAERGHQEMRRKSLVKKLRLQVDELRELVNRNPHMPLGEVQRAVGAVQEII